MKKQAAILFTVGVALILCAGIALGWLRVHQRLGAPGVKTSPIPDLPKGSLKVDVDLPEWVRGYRSEEKEMDEIVVKTLPADTSYGERVYIAPDGFRIQMTAVLMGMDRTSIHKPQFCLEGAGWHIEKEQLERVPIPEPTPYDLPVNRITASKVTEVEGRQVRLTGTYVYWFVDKNSITARHEDRMISMAKSMITKGVLERWAYISCFVYTLPGGEDLAYERVEQFMAEAVPKFQLPGGHGTKSAGTQAVLP